MKLHSHNLKGITLVEMLIVLAIISILSGIAIAIINPRKQQNRARDGVVRNSISGLGQAVDSFYGFNGYYPTAAQHALLTPFIKGYTRDAAESTNTQIVFKNASVFTGGVANGAIIYYTNDFLPATPQLDLPCIEAVSNENPTPPILYIAWAPGYAVQVLTASCSTEAGYIQLTGMDPTP